MVSILVDFRERNLDRVTQDVDQLVAKFRDLKRAGDALGTSNLTQVLIAQSRASQAAARATAEQAKAEQQRQRTQQVSLRTAQDSARAELTKARAQTESARTAREVARAEQEQQRTAQSRLRVQQQSLRNEQELSKAQQQAARVLIEQARATREAARASQTIAGARDQEQRATRTAAERLREYTDANLRLARAANLPLSAVRDLTRELGVTPQRAERLVQRFRELQSTGSSAANTFRVLSRESGISARQFTALNRVIGVTDRQLQNLSTIGAATGVALGGFIASTSSTYLEFQRNIQGAAVRAGEALDEFQGVREEAARLGATTSLTATDISATVDQLSRMGFTANQTEDSLAGLVRGAEGSGEALSTVTSVAGRAINQFGLTAASAGNVTDILVTAANSADVSVSTLGESLKFAGAAASSANQSLEDTAFLISLAGNAGLRGGQAGRNFVSFLTRLEVASAASQTELTGLARGSERAAEALRIIGTNVRDETTGELRSLRDVLPVLRQDLINLRETSPSDFGIVTQALFGTQGRRFANAIINSTDESIAQLEERFGSLEGASARSSEALQQGITGALLQLQSATEGLQLRAFEEFAGLSEGLVRSLTALVRGFQGLDPRIQSFLIQASAIGSILVVAVGALSAYQLAIRTLQPLQSAQAAVTQLQNLRFQAQALASGVATAAQNTYEIATGTATKAQQAQAAAFAQQALRAGLFAGAIASVALAVGQYNAIQAATADTAQAVDTVEDAYQRLIETQARAASTAQEATDEANRANEAAENAAARNAEALQDGLDPVAKTLDPIREGIGSIQEASNNLLASLLKLVSPFDALDQRIDNLVDKIPVLTTAAEVTSNRQKVLFGELVQEVQNVEGAYFDVINTLKAGGDVDPTVLNDLQAAINASTISLQEARPTTEDNIQLRDAQIARLETAKARLDQYAESVGNATDETSEFADETASSADGLAEGYQRELAEIEAAQARTAAELAEQSGLSEAEAQQRAAQEQRAGLEERLAASKEFYEDLRQLAAEDPGNLELQDQLVEAETQFYNDREELAKAGAEERAAAEEVALDATKAAIDEAERAVDASATRRAASLLRLEQQLRAQGVSETEISRRTAQEKLAIEEQGIRDQLELEQQRIDSFAEGTEEQKDAIASKAQLENELLQNQINAEKQFREEQITAIEDAAAAQESATESAIAGADLQLEAFKRIETSLERQSNLLTRQAALSDSVARLRSSSAQADEDEAQRALELIRERNELEENSEDSAERRAQINRELARLGLGSNEADVENILLARTRERFELEQRQLNRRQALERSSLELDIRRNQLAAQRVVTEQQIALARLQGQRQALQSEVAIAQARGETQAVQQGQQALGIIDQQIAGKRELVGLAQENLDLERQTANELRADLDARQQLAQVDLSRSQETAAAELDSDIQSRRSRELANQTAARADAEQREGDALANNLDSLLLTNRELDRTVAESSQAADETRRLADEAERYLAALQGASTSVSGEIPGFRSGGTTPGGAAIVGEAGPEIGLYPKGTRIVSNAQARRWVREAAAINPEPFSRFMRSPIMPSRPTSSIKSVSGDRELISAMQALSQKLDGFQGGYIHNGPQTNRMTMSKGLLKQALSEMTEELSHQVTYDLKRKFNLS